MSNSLPLITCACVTHQKPKMLSRAVRCFEEQSYPNKQLVIVYEEIDQMTYNFIARQQFAENIKLVRIDKKHDKKTLGELRNIAILNADGWFICQWDDDDWYHVDRLFLQYQSIYSKNMIASVLSKWIVYDSIECRAYISHKRMWEGSIMCQKEVFLTQPYAHIPRGEDTDFLDFNYQLDNLVLVEDLPHLYIYVYHGNNTWNYEHFKEIIDCCKKLPEVISIQITKILNLEISVRAGSELLNQVVGRYLHLLET